MPLHQKAEVAGKIDCDAELFQFPGEEARLIFVANGIKRLQIARFRLLTVFSPWPRQLDAGRRRGEVPAQDPE
jgi:hypothetical protein